MSDIKPPKPAIPHKPSPHNVVPQSMPSDYRADPANPYPPLAPLPEVAPKTASARKPAGASVRGGAGGVTAGSGGSAGPVSAPEPAAPPVSPAAEPWRRHSAEPPGLFEQVPIAAPSLAIHSAGTSHSRDHKPLRIAHLYPSVLNVAGDGGNLIALQRRAQWRGIDVEVVAVEKGDTPDFRRFDIVLFHGGQDVEMAVAAEDFARKTPSLRAAVEDGLVVFAVCAGLQLMGHRYVSNAGEEMRGAGILDLETRGGPQRFMQHAACEVTIDGVTDTVVGFENHSGLTVLGTGCEPFGKVVAGAGNNGRDGREGARYKNVFATYLHGPCLPKNPWLTDQLLRIAVGRAEGIRSARVVLSPLNDEAEARAHAMALAKAMANRGHRTALEPARLVRGLKG